MPHLPLFTAPHRVFFAGGVFQLVVALAFWSLELVLRLTGGAPGWAAPPTWLHGGLMLYGIFPWFILGFLTTALPRLLNGAPLEAREYLPAAALMAAGALAYDLGLVWAPAALPGLGVGVLGAALAAWPLLGRLRRGADAAAHAILLLAALAVGLLGAALHGLALTRLDAGLHAAAVLLGLWGFLLPTFFIVLHRLLPFFVASQFADLPPWRSQPVLYAMSLLGLGHALASLAGWPTWPVDLPAAVLAWRCLSGWGAPRALGRPMLAMPLIGWAWIAVALSLFALQDLLARAGIVWGGLAPLHAMGIGGFLSLVLGMGTRVTRGHSGRPIDEDRWGWRAFLLLQAAVVARLAGEFLPRGSHLNALAVLIASAACLLWAAAYAPMYWRPRPDGQPG